MIHFGNIVHSGRHYWPLSNSCYGQTLHLSLKYRIQMQFINQTKRPPFQCARRLGTFHHWVLGTWLCVAGTGQTVEMDSAREKKSANFRRREKWPFHSACLWHIDVRALTHCCYGKTRTATLPTTVIQHWRNGQNIQWSRKSFSKERKQVWYLWTREKDFERLLNQLFWAKLVNKTIWAKRRRDVTQWPTNGTYRKTNRAAYISFMSIHFLVQGNLEGAPCHSDSARFFKL